MTRDVPRVFISHSSKDRALVEQRIIAPLADAGVRPWYSTDDITTADEWQTSIREALGSCAWFLVALSSNAVDSPWVRAEVMWAVENRPARIIPVLIGPCNPSACHLQLPLIQHIDLVSDDAAGRDKLMRVFDDPEPTLDATGERVHVLRRIRDDRDTAQIALVFDGLTDADERVRTRANQALAAIGWPRVVDAVDAIARSAAPPAGQLNAILEGLAALRTGGEVVLLLDRLVDTLRGDVRNRAILLAERKRLALERSSMIEAFRARQSPYEIEDVAGQGLFASSYRGRHRHTGRAVLVRVLRPELAAQPRMRAAFGDLAARSYRYVHQNLLVTRDVGQLADTGVYFIVRDYADGVTLQQAIDDGARLDARAVTAVARQLLEALAAVHALGDAHGGVKPTNVFMCEGGRVLLADPGPPAAVVGAGRERLGYDLRYAAPEAFLGGGDVGPAADHYALGCVLYELLSGAPPFVADSPFELAALHRDGVVDVGRATGDAELGALLEQLLAKDPARRVPDDARVSARAAAIERRLGAASTSPALPEALLDHRPDISIYEVADPGDVYGTIGVRRISATRRTEPRAEARSPLDLEPGDVIGNYEIVGRIGRGGMAAVYEGTHLALRRSVAIKVLGHQMDGDAFLREARIMARLVHVNIVTVFDLDLHEGRPYIVMEHIDGMSLDRLVRERGPLSVAGACDAVAQIGRALGAAFDQDILHRDIKPANALLDRSGRIRVLDFGLARLTGQEWNENSTQPGTIIGTPTFMAPEQIRGRAVDLRADIYSLGCVLHFLLAGHPPFSGMSFGDLMLAHMQSEPPPITEVRSDVPTNVAALIARMLAKEPDERPGSAREVIEGLSGATAGSDLATLLGPPSTGD